MTPSPGDLAASYNHYTPVFHEIPMEDVYTAVPAQHHLAMGELVVIVDAFVRWSGRRHFVLCMSRFGLTWIQPRDLALEET